MFIEAYAEAMLMLESNRTLLCVERSHFSILHGSRAANKDVFRTLVGGG